MYGIGKKRAVIVSDQVLFEWQHPRHRGQDSTSCGIAQPTDLPHIDCRAGSVARVRTSRRQADALFEPDVIIAVGGGSAMDAGKIMWMLYEHPGNAVSGHGLDFMDIRKRAFTFPELGKKAYFVAVPTSSGTGSECTPFAIITDKETGYKWPIADYALPRPWLSSTPTTA